MIQLPQDVIETIIEFVPRHPMAQMVLENFKTMWFNNLRFKGQERYQCLWKTSGIEEITRDYIWIYEVYDVFQPPVEEETDMEYWTDSDDEPGIEYELNF